MGDWNVSCRGNLRFAAQSGVVPRDRVFRGGANRAAAVLWEPEGGLQSVERRHRSFDLSDLHSVYHGDVASGVEG